MVGRLGGVGIGGADVGEVAPGENEEHPAVDRAEEDDGVAVVEPAPVHQNVDPLVGWSIRLAPASSMVRTRSAQGPAAFTTTLALIVTCAPVSRSSIRAPTTRPAVRSSESTAV